MKTQKKSVKKDRIRKDIKLLVLLTCIIFVSVSFLSYDPADLSPSRGTFFQKSYNNLCGVVGAYLGEFFLRNFGIASFLVIFYLILAFISLLTSNNAYVFAYHRLFFACLTILTLAIVISYISDTKLVYRGHALLIGGNFGNYMHRIANPILGSKGGFLIVLSMLIVSFAVSTDFKFESLLLLRNKIHGIKGLFSQLSRNKSSGSEKQKNGSKTLKSRLEKKIEEPASVVMQALNRSDPQEEEFDHEKIQSTFVLPTLELLDDPPATQDLAHVKEVMEATAKKVEQKLLDFGVQGEVTGIQPGPVITLYEFRPAPGVKISRIANLADDLALGLKAVSIRIIAPIPGKDAVGIEVPNPKKEVVYLKEILSSPEFRDSNLKLPLALGKDTVGRPVLADLAKMPHLLVAGATGTGKSVCINAMVNSLLFKFPPSLIKFIMVDPKRIELSLYDNIPHLLHPVVTHPKEATQALKWAVKEMERRYELLLKMGAKNILGYNSKVLKEAKAGDTGQELLPYIIIVIDELADLMMVSSKEVEDSIARLAQMARASGIHLVLATQRPSVDVLTGLIKANFPARISFQVSSKVDSRTILDRMGAEKLLGEGDMLFMPPGVGRLLRIHGAYVSEDEVQRVTDFLRTQGSPNYQITLTGPEEEGEKEEDLEADPKYQEAVDLVIRTGQASISMIQRRLRVGYNRAARMIELMEKQGIVGPSDGIKPREVYGRK